MGDVGDGVGAMAAVEVGLAAGVGVAGGISVGVGVETGGCVGTPAGVKAMAEAGALFAFSASCFLFPDAQPLAHRETTARARNIICRLRMIFVIKTSNTRGMEERLHHPPRTGKASGFITMPYWGFDSTNQRNHFDLM